MGGADDVELFCDEWLNLSYRLFKTSIHCVSRKPFSTTEIRT